MGLIAGKQIAVLPDGTFIVRSPNGELFRTMIQPQGEMILETLTLQQCVCYLHRVEIEKAGVEKVGK